MKNLMACTCGSKWRDEAYAALRVLTGVVFLYHGYAKVFTMGMEGVTGFFTSVGIPFAGLLAVLVSYGELLGGIALIVGFMTHWVAKINILIMLGAIFFVHLANGFNISSGGYEYALTLLLLNFMFLTTGAGKYSYDAKHRHQEQRTGV